MTADSNKTVFISYRRSVSKDRAVIIFNYLRQHGYDVFLDVKTIDSGAFDSVILNQIGARTHFVLLLTNGALERCQNKGDWLRREIEEALHLKRNIIPIIDEGINFDREMAYLPKAWREQFKRINSLPWSHYFFDAALDTLVKRFLQRPAFSVFIKPVSSDENDEVQQRIAQIPPSPPKIITPYTKSQKIMPKPFEWISIPAGQVTLDAGGNLEMPTTFDVPAFEMSKYPITNAQFDVFIANADGYRNPSWWDFSPDAQKWRSENVNPQQVNFTGDAMPRTKVTWYESVAFCRWLSAITGETIVLPAEQEWQRAAQGDDGRKYPWGKQWDGERCNNSAKSHDSHFTTPVDQYEGKGDSPYGVVDMAGNVWEWCSTDYQTGKYDLQGADDRALRGGSWDLLYTAWFRTHYRGRGAPHLRLNFRGFRIARMIE